MPTATNVGALPASLLATNGDVPIRLAGVNTVMTTGATGRSSMAATTAAEGRTAIGAGVSNYVDPLTTRGDTLSHDGTVSVRVAKGAEGYIWRAGTLDPAWVSMAAALAGMGTTQGMTLRRGIGAWEAVTIGTAGYVWTSDGTTAAWAAPAGGGDGTEYNDLSSAVTVNGTGTAAVTSEAVVLSYSDAQDGTYEPGAWTGPRVKLDNVVEFASARIFARLVSIVGDNVTFLKVGVVSEADNQFFGFRIRASDGQIIAYNTGGAVLGAPSPIATDGTGWFAVERHGNTLTWWYGVGTSTDPPTDWVHIYSLVLGSTSDVPGRTIAFGLSKTANALAGSASVDNVYVKVL